MEEKQKPDGYVKFDVAHRRPLVDDTGVFAPGFSHIQVHFEESYKMSEGCEWRPVKLVFLDEQGEGEK